MKVFSPKIDVLPASQQRVWTELAELPPDFTLYGGTAIALHLGHRQSIDFDFFGWHNFAALDLAASIPFLAGGTVLQVEPNTLTMQIYRGGPVKISFFGVPRLLRIAPTLVAPDNGLQVAAMIDLAGTKVAVVQQRAEPKDYIDLDAIFTAGEINLPMALAAGQHIYGSAFSPQNALKALTYFDEPILQVLPKDLRHRLIELVRSVDIDDLPNIESMFKK